MFCDDIDAPGDINVNGLAYEIADAVMFANFFVQGFSAFGTHVDASVAASDTNLDDIPLTISDFVYMARIVAGNVFPNPPTDPSPYPAYFRQSSQISGHVWVDTPDDLGAVSMVFSGEFTPVLEQDHMEMMYGWDSGFTRVLIYSLEEGNSIDEDGLLLSDAFNVELVFVRTATYYSQPVNSVIDQSTDVDEDQDNLPTSFALDQNYPNPFNPVTTIAYQVPQPAHVLIDIFNVSGQRVRTLVNRTQAAGNHMVDWDGKDNLGRAVSSGMYIYRMAAGEFTQSKKMVLLK